MSTITISTSPTNTTYVGGQASTPPNSSAVDEQLLEEIAQLLLQAQGQGGGTTGGTEAGGAPGANETGGGAASAPLPSNVTDAITSASNACNYVADPTNGFSPKDVENAQSSLANLKNLENAYGANSSIGQQIGTVISNLESTMANNPHPFTSLA
jgi:hypothetical protein